MVIKMTFPSGRSATITDVISVRVEHNELFGDVLSYERRPDAFGSRWGAESLKGLTFEIRQ